VVAKKDKVQVQKEEQGHVEWPVKVKMQVRGERNIYSEEGDC
jgi:hypothetical protein